MICYLLCTWCVLKAGPLFCSTFKPVAIIFTAFIGAIFLGDDFSLGRCFGVHFPMCLCCSWMSGMLAFLQLLSFILAKGGGGTCKDTPTLKSDMSYGAEAQKRVIGYCSEVLFRISRA
ncbi:hypothetical protein LR48_Vigan661s002500 [Vigna angularis]|uniref:Uncharacterized protein n=1 Tax=Phaseolus angularis TaxID=3914 RepID=A0A0L9TFL2_PHAAN|nr:hypothetical protein LR48_Vigan661s002500 [Vigna angularis]